MLEQWGIANLGHNSLHKVNEVIYRCTVVNVGATTAPPNKWSIDHYALVCHPLLAELTLWCGPPLKHRVLMSTILIAAGQLTQWPVWHPKPKWGAYMKPGRQTSPPPTPHLSPSRARSKQCRSLQCEEHLSQRFWSMAAYHLQWFEIQTGIVVPRWFLHSQ